MTDIPPKRPKRPRDPAQLAKLMIDIATGEVEDQPQDKGRKAPEAASSTKKPPPARSKP